MKIPESVTHAGYQLAVTGGAALVVVAFPRLRTPVRLLCVGLVATTLLFQGALPAYMLLCATVYVVATRILAARDQPPASRWRFFLILVVVLSAVFIVGRASHAERYGGRLLGVPWTYYYLDMWTLLRLVSFLWETGSGRVRAPAPRMYALWCVLPFTALGPLLRYSEFEPQLALVATPEARAGLGHATWWRRVGLGMLQLALATLIVTFGLPYTAPGGMKRVLVQTFVVGPWSFYLLSAGRFTVMECLARAWGLTLPRSFDNAFIRPNISEFWAHWNMSATRLFRDYLFYNRWGRRTLNVYANVLVLFFLVGLWHDSNVYWMLWGTLHGMAFAAFLWYKKWRATPAGRRLPTIPRSLAVAMTYVFVCACWAAPPQIVKLFARLF